ncbi:hypothetical protein HOF92_13180 [bacterium]|jgi:hypothetical protein|nr:hypothetical protein [bacterium]
MDSNERDQRESRTWLEKVTGSRMLRLSEELIMRLLRRYRTKVTRPAEDQNNITPRETRFLRSVRNEQIRTALSERMPRSLLDPSREDYSSTIVDPGRGQVESPRNRRVERGFWERLITWKKE